MKGTGKMGICVLDTFNLLYKDENDFMCVGNQNRVDVKVVRAQQNRKINILLSQK